MTVEYHAPFVFPVIEPEDGQAPAKPLRFVAGYTSSEQSGVQIRKSTRKMPDQERVADLDSLE